MIEAKETLYGKLNNPEIRPELINLNIEPSTTEQVYKHEGEYGYDVIKVSAVNSDIDTNISPSNIKEGVNILGVTGTLKEMNMNVEDETLIFGANAQVNGEELVL